MSLWVEGASIALAMLVIGPFVMRWLDRRIVRIRGTPPTGGKE